MFLGLQVHIYGAGRDRFTIKTNKDEHYFAIVELYTARNAYENFIKLYLSSHATNYKRLLQNFEYHVN